MLSLKVPPLGESIVEATVSRWLKNEGDAVNAGDTIVELETDKITVEVPALKAGVLTKRSVAEGAVVKVDEVLGELDDSATAATSAAAPAAAPTAAASATPAATSAPAPAAATPAPQAAAAGEVKSSPAARRVADERGIDIAAVPGTGRGGVVSKPDVLQAASAPAATPAAAPSAPANAPRPTSTPALTTTNGASETREKLSTRRKRIADNLLNSHLSTARLTTFNEIDMSAVTALRERVKEKTEKQHGVKLSFMPFFLKASCMALHDFPIVNAQLDGDEVIYKHYVHMGVAVASDQGLIVPNIKHAEQKGLLDLARDMTLLAKRARDGKLTMEDLTGGTFTVTNGGVFGSLISTPILNYPQVGILGLHKIQDRPVAINGKVEIRPMMYVALSYDHRIIDGQQAVLFLVRVKELMEDPATMLIA